MNSNAISIPVPNPIIKPHKLTRAEKHKTRVLREEYSRVLNGLITAQNDLTVALNNFNNTSDPKAVDVWIYRIHCAQSEYDNMLCHLKALTRQIKYPDYSI